MLHTAVDLLLRAPGSRSRSSPLPTLVESEPWPCELSTSTSALHDRPAQDHRHFRQAPSTRRHLAIDEVVRKLEDIRTQVAAFEAPAAIRDAFIASTEPPPIDHAAQGGAQPRGPLRRLVTLHDYAGQDVTIGHRRDDFDGLETVIWCDTCQQLVSTEATGSACHSDDFMVPYRYQPRPQEVTNS